MTMATQNSKRNRLFRAVLLSIAVCFMTIGISFKSLRAQPSPRICNGQDTLVNVFFDLTASEGSDSGDKIGPYPVMSENVSFQGKRLILNRSSSNLNEHGFNDKASALCVPDGWRVVFYEDSDYRGASLTLPDFKGNRSIHHLWNYDTSNRRGLRGLHDRISSVRVYDSTGTEVDSR